VSIDAAGLAEHTRNRPGALRRFLRNPLGIVAGVALLLIVAMTALAPLIAPLDPTTPMLDQINAGPNDTYVLGGDSAGRDVLSRLIWGGRSTLYGALIVVVVTAVVGIVTGLLAAYLGRFTDIALSWVSDALLAIPSVIVLIALYAAIGPDVTISMVVFGLLISPFLYRLVRTMAIEVKNEPFVEAAQVAGLGTVRIVFRHVLAVIRGPIIVMLADIAATGIGIQASLEFLGLGSVNSVTWGGMVQDAFNGIYRAPLNVVWPGLMLTVTIASVALIGNAVRDALVPGNASPRKARSARTTGASGDIVTTAAPSADTVTATVAAGEPLVSLRNLRIGYPTFSGSVSVVVSDVSLDVMPGEVLGLVGESGSGKSQTVLSVLGLLPPQAQTLAGTMTFDGQTIDRRQHELLRGRSIAYVPQEPMSNLDPLYPIGVQLARPLQKVKGMSRVAARRRAVELLERVGIHDPAAVARLYPHQISGGMAQRVLIAGAISSEPRLLIADEPTTALDVTVQAEILELLRDLQRERSMAILIVTHNFGVVADICDRVAVMRGGRIVEAGPVDDIFTRPQHDYTRLLLGSTLENATPRTYSQGATA
jgi:peptide/nickel transport system permease protein